MSGALLKSVVERAKDFAIKRSIEKKSETEGVTLDDIQKADAGRVQGERDLPEERHAWKTG